jgi:D-alanine-D-alanine ligase
MKTKVGVFFGGRSVEHEISVISALQAIAALDAEKYEAVPVYITKQGRWFTGGVLLDAAAYRDMEALERRATEVVMAPRFLERRLVRVGRGVGGGDGRKSGGDYRSGDRGGFNGGFGALFGRLFGGRRVVAELDIVLPVLHGTNGEDGALQGFLELIGIPYVGCGVLASALGMDKIAAKMVLRQSGIPVIDYVWFTDRQWHAERDALTARIETELGWPVIVKPSNLGSSVGISRARDREELGRAVGEAAGYSSRLLVERMIEPLREINCSVVGSVDDHRTSVCEEPLRSSEILSYTDKYMPGGNARGGSGSKGGDARGGKFSASEDYPGSAGGAKAVSGGAKTASGGVGAVSEGAGGAKTASGGVGAVSEGMSGTRRRIPADLPEELSAEIRRLASETFRALGCEGVARVDFILDDTKIYVNEINTIPGSLSFYLWEATGLSFPALLDELVAGALKRDRDKARKTVSYSDNIFSMGAAGTGAKSGSKSGAK